MDAGGERRGTGPSFARKLDCIALQHRDFCLLYFTLACFEHQHHAADIRTDFVSTGNGRGSANSVGLSLSQRYTEARLRLSGNQPEPLTGGATI